MKWKKKLATVAVTAALVVPQATAPATAQSSLENAVASSSFESLEHAWSWLNPVNLATMGIVMSSMALSFFWPGCGIMDTRQCNW